MNNDTVVSLAAPARVSDTELLRVRGVVGVRPGAAARRAPAGGSQRPPSGTQDSHRCGCPRHAAARVRPSRSALRWCLPTFGAAQASMRRFRGCTGGRRAGGRGGRPWVVGERRQSAQRIEEYRQWCRRRLRHLVGGRHLQRPSQRARAAVRAGGQETLPGHRGRGARVHPELARGAAGDETARLHAPGEARRGRRGTGVLGGAVGGVSNDNAAAGCTRPGTS